MGSRFHRAEVLSEAMYLHSLELQLPLLFVQRTLQPEGAAGESGLSHRITGGNTTGVCELCEEGERNVHSKQCDMKKRKVWRFNEN